MIERFFQAVAAFVYGEFARERIEERQAAARAFREMKDAKDAEYARLVLTGR
jgi:hypothetical protein